MTTHGDQLREFGGVPTGWGPLSMMGYKSKHIWVHGGSGVDQGSGENPRRPVKTLTYAYSKCVDGRGDVVHVLNDGSTAASIRDAALVWAKDNTHLIGHCAPTINQRSRVTPPTTITDDVDAYTPLFTLSASGCIIRNVSWYQGQSENKASVGMLVSGSRNRIEEVSVITGAHATQANNAIINMQMTGSENTVVGSYIGCDTTARGGNTISSNVRFGGDAAEEATRNVFKDCIFAAYADDTEPVFIYAKTAFDTQRWNLFENCKFFNTGTSTMAGGVNWADSTGKLFLKDSPMYGVTDIEATVSGYVFAYGLTAAITGGVDVGHFKVLLNS